MRPSQRELSGSQNGAKSLHVLAASLLALTPRSSFDWRSHPGVQHSSALSQDSRLNGVGMAASELQMRDDHDNWIETVDLKEFGREVRALGRRLANEEGKDHLAHFEKVRRWSDACGIIGVLSMALPLNPITVIALSTWTYSRWTMIAHHTCHGGYDRHGNKRYHGRRFALGGALQRARDWLDWMLPEAWNHEHNALHHYKLGEIHDPDLVERNLESLRDSRGPRLFKYIFIAAMAGIWKWAYYAPNTYNQLKIAEYSKQHDGTLPDGLDPTEALTMGRLLQGDKFIHGLFSPLEFFSRVLLPVIILRFLLLPAPLLLLPNALGLACYQNAIANLIVADVVSNLHSFLTIVTNHAGNDLYRFENSCAPNSPEFFLRQVISSANFRTGSDANDFLHGFLNYQIEHHCWPTLSMLSYQRGAPELQKICERHGVPYVQENVFERLRKTVNIMVGTDSMRKFPVGTIR